MAMRATAAAAASLRAAGVSASGGGRVPVPGCGGGGGVSGLIYGRFLDAPASARAVEAAARGGGTTTRSFFSFGKGRGNDNLISSPIAEVPMKNEQLVLENSTDSAQNWKISQLKLELNVEKAFSRQRMEYEAKLSAVQKDYETRLADQKKDFNREIALVKKDFDEKIDKMKTRQDESFNRIVDVETDTKLLSQNHDNFKESWNLKAENMQYSLLHLSHRVTRRCSKLL